jgi:uncharacterized YigZ family protein
MMMDEYKTLEGLSEGLYKEKGSRFIAIAGPVQSLEEVRQQLEKIRKQFHDARHHCYAYRIGKEPFEMRYNDDGEPSGTAGKPIYGQILSFGLTNVLIVVVRYFGGIKLGTGGLIQAYKAASMDALNNGTIVTRTWMEKMAVDFKYQQMNEVMHLIKEEGLQIIAQDFQLDCHIMLEIRQGKIEELARKLSSFETVNCRLI